MSSVLWRPYFGVRSHAFANRERSQADHLGRAVSGSGKLDEGLRQLRARSDCRGQQHAADMTNIQYIGASGSHLYR